MTQNDGGNLFNADVFGVLSTVLDDTRAAEALYDMLPLGVTPEAAGAVARTFGVAFRERPDMRSALLGEPTPNTLEMAQRLTVAYYAQLAEARLALSLCKLVFEAEGMQTAVSGMDDDSQQAIGNLRMAIAGALTEGVSREAAQLLTQAGGLAAWLDVVVQTGGTVGNLPMNDVRLFVELARRLNLLTIHRQQSVEHRGYSLVAHQDGGGAWRVLATRNGARRILGPIEQVDDAAEAIEWARSALNDELGPEVIAA